MNKQDETSQRPAGDGSLTDALICYGMGMEDFTLGRPHRGDQAPDSSQYQQGWDFAAAEADPTAYDTDGPA